MTRRHRTRLIAAALAAVAAVAVGVGVAVGGGGDESKSPKVLNRPTDARRPRVFKPGPERGFAPPRFEREKHGE